MEVKEIIEEIKNETRTGMDMNFKLDAKTMMMHEYGKKHNIEKVSGALYIYLIRKGIEADEKQV